MKIAVLASGRGSNLLAIADAIERGACGARIVVVASDKADAGALGLAAARGIPTAVVPPKAHGSREQWDAALAETVGSFAPELVVLAGFMRIVGRAMLERFPSRIVNVHPALLPSFPGAHGARDAIARRVRISGCTVHLVDEGVDTGPILAQAAVPVAPSDDEASLQARIQRVEHRLLPAVIDAIATGRITLGEAGPTFAPDLVLDERALVSPVFRDPPTP